MNKKFTYLLIIFLGFSCKDKIPNNILKQMETVEIHLKGLNEKSNIILNLTQNQIDNLSLDSISSILLDYSIWEEEYGKSKNKLDDLLKYNSVFSDYEEVKNVLRKPDYYNKLDKFHKNENYLGERLLYLQRKKYGLDKK